MAEDGTAAASAGLQLSALWQGQPSSGRRGPGSSRQRRLRKHAVEVVKALRPQHYVRRDLTSEAFSLLFCWEFGLLRQVTEFCITAAAASLTAAAGRHRIRASQSPPTAVQSTAAARLAPSRSAPLARCSACAPSSSARSNSTVFELDGVARLAVRQKKTENQRAEKLKPNAPAPRQTPASRPANPRGREQRPRIRPTRKQLGGLGPPEQRPPSTGPPPRCLALPQRLAGHGRAVPVTQAVTPTDSDFTARHFESAHPAQGFSTQNKCQNTGTNCRVVSQDFRLAPRRVGGPCRLSVRGRVTLSPACLAEHGQGSGGSLPRARVAVRTREDTGTRRNREHVNCD